MYVCMYVRTCVLIFYVYTRLYVNYMLFYEVGVCVSALFHRVEIVQFTKLIIAHKELNIIIMYIQKSMCTRISTYVHE